MKLEFLAEGADDRSLIRLYDFDPVEATRLREAFRSLWTGVRQSIPLHEEWWIAPLEQCSLELRLGARDLGVVQRAPSRFECLLTAEGWAEMTVKVDPFCGSEDANGRRWLNRDGEIALLLSPDGQW